MKIAIVGGGVSGNILAWKLYKDYDITLFEANNYLGGHTHTHDIESDSERVSIDTGFIVYNELTYPEFVSVLDEFAVKSIPTQMSFSVRSEASGLEYNGANLNSLFAQRKNIFRPSFYKMIQDILKFNREAPAVLDNSSEGISLGSYLSSNGYSKHFIDNYLLPMGAAIWSTDPHKMTAFPARFFIRFLLNHGLLSINNRPQWRVIKGGSKKYLDAISQGYRKSIRLDCPVSSIQRQSGCVRVKTKDGCIEYFDHVFLACHSDQALAMLHDPSNDEREVLSALPYQLNEAVLHSDIGMMPRNKRAWAAWNYHVPGKQSGQVGVTYNMNILQQLSCQQPYLVTLNQSDRIDPAKVIRKLYYEHPLFTLPGMRAQLRHGDINGVRNTWYCGAYWGNGFHEDGVVSALRTIKKFQELAGNEKLYLRRAS
jgi:uncharacterized protein